MSDAPDGNIEMPAVQPIRQAATVVLLRDSAAGEVEVLMVQRSRGASFMADAHVFPGGRLDASDGGDHALAAAREAFEEAGVLSAVDAAGLPAALQDSGFIESARLIVQKGQRTFVSLLAEKGLRPDTSGFAYFARWITPPTETRRFDARFFLARQPPHQEAAPDHAGEVVDFRWTTPRAILEAQARGEVKLAPPTLWHLGDLATIGTVDEALGWARARTIVAVRPKLLAWHGIVTIMLPWDPEYADATVPGDDGEPISPDSPVAGPITRYEVVDARWVGRRVTR